MPNCCQIELIALWGTSAALPFASATGGGTDVRSPRSQGVARLSPGPGVPDGERWVGAAQRFYDWTNGCIAVTDDEMDEIWELVDDGTPIEIRP